MKPNTTHLPNVLPEHDLGNTFTFNQTPIVQRSREPNVYQNKTNNGANRSKGKFT